MTEEIWEVVGGGDKGGLLVRLDEDIKSAPFEERLATGSIVKQWDLVNDRLQYELVDGEGPPLGWVLTKLKGKHLLVKLDPRAKRRERLGGDLPPIPRDRRCPGLLAVPERSRPTYQKIGVSDDQRVPKLYVFMFPGAEDEVMNGWLRLEREAPAHVELATYEWPGHGTRRGEGFAHTLEELGDDAFETFRGPMQAGHFVVCGHSIGALILLYVCERAKRDLRVAPQLAVVLDRGAPHLKVLSDQCEKLLLDKPDVYASYFMQHLRPGSDGWTMRINDQILDQDTRPIGWYKFSCRVLVYAAGAYRKPADASPGGESKPGSQEGGASAAEPSNTSAADSNHPVSEDAPPADTQGTPPQNTESEDSPPGGAPQEQEEGFSHYRSKLDHPFVTEEYELWSRWADDVRFKELAGVTHFELKTHDSWKQDMLKEIERILRNARV